MGAWNQLITGDLAQLSGSHSNFLVTNLALEQVRCEEFDIHPTGPLVGKVKRNVTDAAKELEESVLNTYSEINSALKSAMDGKRRALRVLPQKLNWQWDDNILTLSFYLPSGSYATVLLEQIFTLA